MYQLSLHKEIGSYIAIATVNITVASYNMYILWYVASYGYVVTIEYQAYRLLLYNMSPSKLLINNGLVAT